MNRKKFLRLLGFGSVAAAVAPQMLVPKEPIIVGTKEILAMQESMINNIANIPPYGWYSDQERLAEARMMMDFEQAMMFGERRESNRKYYTGGIWNSQL